jgi:AraC family transcriptional regulator
MDSPVWKPRCDTCVTSPSLRAMYGGPVGMHLPEHEHDDLQVGMHFTAPRGRTRIGLSEEPSCFTLIPSRKPHVGRWEDGTEVVVLLFGAAQMEQAAERPVRLNQEISDTGCSVDPLIQAIGSTLRREFYTGAIADLQYLEAIGTVLSGHLIRRWSTGSVALTGRGGLSSGQLRKIIDLAEAAPMVGLSIAALARQLDMGEHRFTRLFRRSTGLTPYQFLLKKRLDRARTLLEETRVPIAELALELGFGSQSHFTSMFHQRFSITPAAYRRERNFMGGK